MNICCVVVKWSVHFDKQTSMWWTILKHHHCLRAMDCVKLYVRSVSLRDRQLHGTSGIGEGCMPTVSIRRMRATRIGLFQCARSHWKVAHRKDGRLLLSVMHEDLNSVHRMLSSSIDTRHTNWMNFRTYSLRKDTRFRVHLLFAFLFFCFAIIAINSNIFSTQYNFKQCTNNYKQFIRFQLVFIQWKAGAFFHYQLSSQKVKYLIRDAYSRSYNSPIHIFGLINSTFD